MKRLSVILFILLLAGCALPPHANLFIDSPEHVTTAQDLAEQYLTGQFTGESYVFASEKYGPGVVEFFGLKQAKLVMSGRNFRRPFLRYRLLATNRMGATIWATYDIFFLYSEEADKTGDRFKGLRISRVHEAMQF